jgi:hypothetical protein
MTKPKFSLAAVLLAGCCLAAPVFAETATAAAAVAAASQDLKAQELQDLAVEAYVYLYPLVMMDTTRRMSTNVPAGVKQGFGPPNSFHHFLAFPPADFRGVVRPNFDTLYSSAWLDLTREPVIVSAPDTQGRYYLLPMMDMWTDVFAAPGKRTSGTGAAHFAVVPQGWTGELPQGVQRIDSPSPYVWIIGRTQTNGPKDYNAVHEVQKGYEITPLSRWRKPKTGPTPYDPDPSVDMKGDPLGQVNGMNAAEFFAAAAEILKANPPHATDWSTISRLKRLGIEPGKSFDLDKAAPEVKAALEKAPADALALLKEKAPTFARVVNGWQMNTDTMGVYGDYYLKRGYVAMAGLGANQPEDAIYPINISDADGKPVDGANNYVLRFAKSDLPPVGAFWSVTMYDAEGFPVANAINRFAIGDRDALNYNEDGSLDIFIQRDKPAADRLANWLPSASGPLGITMRLYAPRPEALDGRWAPPPLKRVN